MTSILRHRATVARVGCFVAMIVTLHAPRLEAQYLHLRGGTPVTIIAVDSYKYKAAKAVIVRRAHLLPHDVIVVKKAHNKGQFLADAIFTLREVRSAQGDIPMTDAVIQVNDRAKHSKRSVEAQGWANTLETTRANPLEGFGVVKQVIVYLPNAKRRLTSQ